jgi:hypothetical protein
MLSDKQKEKITFIQDISKALLFLYDEPITVEEFDDLYDKENFELWYILKDLDGQIALERHHSLQI